MPLIIIIVSLMFSSNLFAEEDDPSFILDAIDQPATQRESSTPMDDDIDSLIKKVEELKFSLETSKFDKQDYLGERPLPIISRANLVDLGEESERYFKHEYKDKEKLFGCYLDYMENLGWNVVKSDDISDLQIDLNFKIFQTTPLTKNQNKRQMNLVVPRSWNNGEIFKYAANLKMNYSGHSLVLGAYKMKYAKALNKVLTKILKKTNYTFPKKIINPESGEEEIGDMVKLPSSHWNCNYDVKYKNSMGCLAKPSVTSSEAIDAIYDAAIETECFNASYLLPMLVEREVYGSDIYNKIYQNGTLTIGYVDGASNHFNFWNYVLAIPEAIDTMLDSSYKLRHKGPLLAIGLRGAIINEGKFRKDLSTLENPSGHEVLLDSKPDRNENFVIVHMSENSYRSLVSLGTANLSDKMLEAWKQLGKLKKYKNLNSDFKNKQKRNNWINRFLNDPFFTETQVYVHPLGVMSIRDHIVRLFKKNPRMPYRIRLLDTAGVNTWSFDKYQNYFIGMCMDN
ncbi:MAG: hypothetical protein HOO06_04685 [Bdellovibrionaceae bacterium]|jgi:hypothetical protein|nr:hypothetical protein [Pseudobdellovibrionaceae bacterium]